MNRVRTQRGGMALVAVLLVLTGCSNGAGSSGEGSPDVEASTPVEAGTQVETPAAKPDYSQDAGHDLPEYVYPDIPPPPDSTVGTLCNLSQEFLVGIRGPNTAAPDPNLGTLLVGLEDLIREWEVLAPHYPEHAQDFDTVREVFESWHNAVMHAENGDLEAAGEAMRAAEKALGTLPATAPEECS